MLFLDQTEVFSSSSTDSLPTLPLNHNRTNLEPFSRSISPTLRPDSPTWSHHSSYGGTSGESDSEWNGASWLADVTTSPSIGGCYTSQGVGSANSSPTSVSILEHQPLQYPLDAIVDYSGLSYNYLIDPDLYGVLAGAIRNLPSAPPSASAPAPENSRPSSPDHNALFMSGSSVNDSAGRITNFHSNGIPRLETRNRKISKREAIAERRIYQCTEPNCGRVFKRSEHVKRHYRSIHTQEKPYECPYVDCTKRFSRSDNLNQHIRIHRQNGGAGSTRFIWPQRPIGEESLESNDNESVSQTYYTPEFDADEEEGGYELLSGDSD